ncbi:MAG: RNA polymerase sigma factor [Chloroflexota bacterium]|nr:RNA polymerase sigma factor [Chloroflexota bacterium]
MEDVNSSRPVADRRADEEEADLARRAALGDRRAFAALYDRHLNAVYRYAFYRLRTDEEADDLTSEVFHRALVAMPKYEPRRPFLAFLYGIARHVVADRLRAAKPHASFADAIAHPSDVPGLEDIAARLDDARRLRAAIGRLTPLQQEVVILRFLEERSSKEVAAFTGKPESTIRGIQMRALAALRELLDEGPRR